MPLILADRVRDTTTTTGTGTVTLSGTAPTGYQNFSVIGNGNTTYYTINAGSQWEVGIGTYSSTGPTLARNTVLESSNANALVDFAAGTKDVFVTYPSDEAVYQDGAVIAAGTAVLGVANGGTGVTTSTGTGSVVLSNSPTLVTPTLGAASATSIANGLGAVGTPSYTFTGDLNTGMWSPSSDAIAFSTAGSERARITSDGSMQLSVGGVSNTHQFLYNESGAEIQLSDATGNGPLLIDNSSGLARFYKVGTGGMSVGTTGTGALQFISNNAERMVINSAGNVGIGGSPSVRLDVVGNVLAREDNAAGANPVLLRNSNTGNNTGKSTSALFQGTDTVGTVKSIGSVGFFPDDANYIGANLRFLVRGSDAAPTERMRITSAGNVGIGTSSPSERLDTGTGSTRTQALVVSGDQHLIYSASATELGIRIGTGGPFYGIGTTGSNNMRINSASGGDILFATAGTERARINNSGQFLVGTTSGGRTVCINAADNWIRQSNPSRSWLIGPSNGSNYLIFDETGGGTRLTIETNGVVTASGDFRAPIFYDSNNTAFFLDPSSTSILNVVRTNALQFSNGNTANDLANGTYNILCDPSGRIAMYLGNGDPANYYDNTAHNFRNRGGGQYAFINANGMYAPTFFDSNNTGFFLDPASSSFLNTVSLGAQTWRADVTWNTGVNILVPTGAECSFDVASGGTWQVWDVTAGGPFIQCTAANQVQIGLAGSRGLFVHGGIASTGNVTASGDFVVGNGQNQSYIYMQDANEGQRIIHCNSNRVGFLTQAGGWGAWCEDNGSWRTDVDMWAPIFYDINDSFFYLNLNGYSQVNGFGSVNGSAGVGMSIMGNVSNGAIMSFHRSAAFAVNMGLDTDNVLRIGGWSAAANRLQMDMSGNLTMAGNVTAFSDIRLKKDIETIDGALDLVSKMRGVRFTRIENEERNVGVIAQEMLEICPEVVQQGVGDDDTLSVAYGNLVGVLIEAIKELTARVAYLENTTPTITFEGN